MAIAPDAVRRGAVVLVRLYGDKARPAIVVRSDLLSELPYATVLPITSMVRPPFVPASESLRIDLAPSEANGLEVPSQVMVDWPATARLTEFGAVIGHLDVATMQAITRELAIVLGIGSEPRS